MKPAVKKMLEDGKLGECLNQLNEKKRSKLLHQLEADSSKEVLTIHDTATLLRMSEPAIRNGVKRGTLPALLIGNRLRFGRQAILDRLNFLNKKSDGRRARK